MKLRDMRSFFKKLRGENCQECDQRWNELSGAMMAYLAAMDGSGSDGTPELGRSGELVAAAARYERARQTIAAHEAAAHGRWSPLARNSCESQGQLALRQIPAESFQ
jgi:hypothetical protein